MLSALIAGTSGLDKRFAGAWFRKHAGLVFGIVVAGFSSTGYPEAMPLTAPLNPDFVQQQMIAKAKAKSISAIITQSIVGDTVGGRAKGLIPSPVDRSHMVGLTPTGRMHAMVSGSASGGTYPSSFDLRSSGFVTSVKNQGKCNDCWSFSSIASVESNALMGSGGNYDFSENHQNVRSGFDWGPCNAGNDDIAGAYMTRWGSSYDAGLVYETDDPYTQNAINGTPPYTSASGLSPRVHLQEFLVLPNRGSGTDNNNYKFAIQNYGAVSVSLYADTGMSNSSSSTYWQQATNAYYYNGSVASNHEVVLIGWDDNYLASNFSTTPPGNGAFIAKNQWGTNWGNSGYFYISYYDSKLNDAHVFRTPESNNNYTRSYLYDPYGHNSSYGYSSSTPSTAWGANVFTAAANETLRAVAFNTLTINGSYEIYIYSNVTGAPSTGVLEGGTVNSTGSFPYAGYHTVALSRPVALIAGQKFAVAIKFTMPNYNYPIPTQTQISGYDSAASSSAGQSYVSSGGSTWTDLNSANTTVNIRAFSGTSQATAQTIGVITFSPTTLTVGGTSTASATATSGLAVSFSSSTPTICSVSGSAVTGIAAGTCIIAANQTGNANFAAANQVTQSIAVISQSDCIFNWAERTYPQFFSPQGAADATFSTYTYRHYSGTGTYLTVTSGNNNIYVVGSSFGNNLVTIGPVSSFLGVSGCQ
jgi:C1A family cysteine protease